MTDAHPTSESSNATAGARENQWKVSNPLFEAIVGTSVANAKAACVIAAQVEEDLIERGWPVGSIYGSEAQLVAKFGVCCVVVRESVRILQSRGTAEMRRGPNGGLVVLAPSMPVVLGAIHRYVTSHRREFYQGSACCTIMHATHARLTAPGSQVSLGHGLTDFIEALISAVDRYALQGPAGHVPLGAAAESARSRAEHVFRLLMKDLCNGTKAERRLGSEIDLCHRYGADRNVLRQAVRVLEFEGIAESVAGRGKGLMARTPEPAALCRLINCYFTAARVTPRDAMGLFKLLSVEAISLAAKQATEKHLARLMNAQRLLEATEGHVSAEMMREIEESQFCIIEEPLIDILLRATKSYTSWSSSPIRNAPCDQLGSLYRTETLKVLSALLNRDPGAAAAAQASKVDRLNELVLNPEQTVAA